jgi:hypothetical protein
MGAVLIVGLWNCKPLREALENRLILGPVLNSIVNCVKDRRKAASESGAHSGTVGPGSLTPLRRWAGTTLILGRVLKGIVSYVKTQTVADSNQQLTLVVVDTLNLLAQIVLNHIRLTNNVELDLRRAVKRICEGLHKRFPNAVVLLVGEYHPGNNLASIVSESFLCDVEILLAREPVAGEARRSGREIAGVGYNLERTLGESPQAVETRSFCRVLKSRFAPNQARRCSYDIVPGRGLVFYETYPADGHIVLFAENARQRRCWDEFYEAVVPHLYPALRHEMFDRSALQRVFASQRRLRDVPERTDMYLSSFDSYWVN